MLVHLYSVQPAMLPILGCLLNLLQILSPYSKEFQISILFQPCNYLFCIITRFNQTKFNRTSCHIIPELIPLGDRRALGCADEKSDEKTVELSISIREKSTERQSLLKINKNSG